MVSRLSKLSSLDVFTEEGLHVGVVNDVAIDTESGRIVDVVVGKVDSAFLQKIGAEASSKSALLPYRAVKSAEDIMVIRKVKYEPAE